MKKHTANFARYFSYYFIAPFLLRFVYPITDIAQEILAKALPSIFKTWSQINEKDAYLAQRELIGFVSIVIVLFIVGIISIMFDNIKNEHLISETDGLYTIKEGAEIYIKKFLKIDLAVGAVVPLIFAIPAFIKIDLPKRFGVIESFIENYFSIAAVPVARYGAVLGLIALVIICIMTRFVGAYLGLKRWRGIWLSDFGR